MPRKTLDGVNCFHYDAHISTAVFEKSKKGSKEFEHVMSYITAKFQEHIRDNFIIQKRSVKFYKKRTYKDANTNLRDPKKYSLAAEVDKEVFIRVKKKLEDDMLNQGVDKVNIPDPSNLSKDVMKMKEEEKLPAKDLKLPGGQTLKPEDKTAPKAPAPVIQEVSKKMKPNFEVKPNLEKGQIDVIVHVEAESSAKEIDLDISETAVKLSSPK
jgi:hypothetical protein